MLGRILGAAAIAFGLAAPASAAVYTYEGTFGDMGWYGSFGGMDLNGDGKLTGDELDYAQGIYESAPGGPSAFYGLADRIDRFVFTVLGNGSGLIHIDHNFRYESWHCGNWDQPPCEIYKLYYPDAPHWTYAWYPVSTTLTNNIAFTAIPAAVPLPGTLPLIAGGIGALAALRRRQKARA